MLAVLVSCFQLCALQETYMIAELTLKPPAPGRRPKSSASQPEYFCLRISEYLARNDDMAIVSFALMQLETSEAHGPSMVGGHCDRQGRGAKKLCMVLYMEVERRWCEGHYLSSAKLIASADGNLSPASFLPAPVAHGTKSRLYPISTLPHPRCGCGNA